MTLPKWLQSSADEQQMALTVKGVLTGIVPILLAFSNIKGWHITQGQLDPIIDGIVAVLNGLFVFVSAVMILLGLIRKIVYASTQNQQP